MTWGCCGNDVMSGNDVRRGPRDSRLRGNDMVGRGNDVRWVFGLEAIRRGKGYGTAPRWSLHGSFKRDTIVEAG